MKFRLTTIQKELEFFKKLLQLRSNAKNTNVILRIKGEVLPEPDEEEEEEKIKTNKYKF